MDTDRRGGGAEDGLADLVGICNDAGAGDFDIRQSLVEGCHGIPEIRLGTPRAAVTDTDRPHSDIVEADRRTVGEGLRAFAADFVKTVAELMELVAELLDETAFVEVRTTFAMVMNSAAVGEERTVQMIECGQSLEGWCRGRKLGSAGSPGY